MTALSMGAKIAGPQQVSLSYQPSGGTHVIRIAPASHRDWWRHARPRPAEDLRLVERPWPRGAQGLAGKHGLPPGGPAGAAADPRRGWRAALRAGARDAARGLDDRDEPTGRGRDD